MDGYKRLKVDNGEFQYKVTRSNRKTVGISINHDEGVKVSAPKWVTLKTIEEILIKKSGWIKRKLTELSNTPKIPVNRVLTEGMIVSFMGENYVLRISPEPSSKSAAVRLESGIITVCVPVNMKPEDRYQAVMDALVKWYRLNAKNYVNERINHFASKMGVTPARVVIKQQKSRWGSCSSKQNININWRIIMAPSSVIDYVIVHELAHLKEMNHSVRFWQFVERFSADFKKHREWLKLHGVKLHPFSHL